MFRRFLAPLLFGAVVTALTVRAEPAPVAKPGKPAVTPAIGTTDVASKQALEKQQLLLRQYKAVAEDLLTLAHRLEKSSRLEDQDKAKLIRRAIELGDKEGVENKFQTLLRTLAGKSTLIGVTQAANQNEELINVLKQILDILNSDDELARLKAEKDFLEKRLAELKALIRETKVARAVTESGKGNPNKIAKDQDKIAKGTNDLAKRLEGKDPNAPDGKGGDGKAKDGKDGKGGDGKAKDGKDGKGDGMGKGKDGKGKDGKGDGMGKGKDGKGKDGKGDGMGKGKDGKGKDGKGDGMGKGKDGKGDGMGKDGKGGKGDGMGDGIAKDGKGGGGDSPPSPPGPKSPGADEVRKAVPDQEQAKKDLEENKRPDAAQKQSDAIDKLQKAQAELEKRLKQLREEELERLLANLEARVAKMLQWQIEVYEATKSIDAIVLKSESKRPEKAEIQKSQVQADKESDIISEANKTIEILKAEGSGVAFPGVAEETVKDMVRVRERLNQANTGDETQALEKDIISSLKEMLEALKKAQQDLKDQKSKPGQSSPSGPQDQKLLDEIAELKLLRSLQVKVNERTKRYGKGLKDGAEQGDAKDPQLKAEVKDVAARQVRIESMARDIATGKNK